MDFNGEGDASTVHNVDYALKHSVGEICSLKCDSICYYVERLIAIVY